MFFRSCLSAQNKNRCQLILSFSEFFLNHVCQPNSSLWLMTASHWTRILWLPQDVTLTTTLCHTSGSRKNNIKICQHLELHSLMLFQRRMLMNHLGRMSKASQKELISCIITILNLDTSQLLLWFIMHVTVFCSGFQKGRVPSEKGTLALWTDRQKGTLARWTEWRKRAI